MLVKSYNQLGSGLLLSVQISKTVNFKMILSQVGVAFVVFCRADPWGFCCAGEIRIQRFQLGSQGVWNTLQSSSTEGFGSPPGGIN